MKVAPIACAIALVTASVRAGADGSARVGADLEWRAAPGCSSREQVLAEVERSVGPATDPNRRVFARATVQQVEGGPWRVTLVFESGGAARKRSFNAESCEAAAGAVAFILAAAIDPSVASAPSEPASAPPLAPAIEPTTDPVSTPASPPPPPRASSLVPPSPIAPAPATAPERASISPSRGSIRLTVAPALALDAGTLPNAAPGAELAVGVRAGRLRVEVAGAAWGSQSPTTPTSGAGARLHVYTGDLRLGFGWRLGPVTLAPVVCAGLEVIGASGFGGSVSNFSPTGIFPAFGGGGLLTWTVAAHFAFRLSLEVEVPLLRPTFVVLEPPPASASVVNEPSIAFGRASAGVELDF